jgi:hypothetical protein
MNYIFNGAAKTITIKPGRCDVTSSHPLTDTYTYCTGTLGGTFTLITSVDVADIYSAWKHWLTTQPASALGQTTPAFQDSVGGNPIGSGLNLGSYYFLSDDWILSPDNRSHELTISGNLFPETPGDHMIKAIPYQTISLTLNTSSLTQQVETTGSVAAADVAAAVWDADTSAHTTAGSFGEYVGKKLLTFAKFLALK